LAKVTGPNQFSLAVGLQTTAKIDDWVFCWVRVDQSLVFYIVFLRSLSVLYFMASNYPFDIFQLYL